MCILFIAVNQHPDYPLIIAANRDEFHQRPTAASLYWDEYPEILAGKDLQAGGTWMGVNKMGRVAALTNIRAPGREVENAITRGNLVLDWLKDTCEPSASEKSYRQEIGRQRTLFNGYNLLFGQLDNLYVYNNFEDSFIHLEDGVFGLSNDNLDSPWPKIMKGRDALANACKEADALDKNRLFDILADKEKADDATLPQTGVPIEWERQLSSIFIKGENYGTRSSTILTLDQHRNVNWEERVFNPFGDKVNSQTFKFSI
jgi:uncharacterized protein with NRDE domain